MNKSNIKKFFEFVTTADKPSVKPGIKEPTTKPSTRPNRRSPIRRDKPSVRPRPKAEFDEIYDKLLDTVDVLDMEKIKKYYSEYESEENSEV